LRLWRRSISKKSDAFDQVLNIIAYVTLISPPVKMVRFDGGGEFNSRALKSELEKEES
jgi:hypothetical protein